MWYIVFAAKKKVVCFRDIVSSRQALGGFYVNLVHPKLIHLWCFSNYRSNIIIHAINVNRVFNIGIFFFEFDLW